MNVALSEGSVCVYGFNESWMSWMIVLKVQNPSSYILSHTQVNWLCIPDSVASLLDKIYQKRLFRIATVALVFGAADTLDDKGSIATYESQFGKYPEEGIMERGIMVVKDNEQAGV